MKYVAYVEGVHSPAYALIEEEENLEKQIQHLSFPLFVKPAKAGDSLGIDDKSLVQSFVELKEKTHSIIDEYGPLLIEEYIKGREFTVMVTASAGEINGVKSFNPIEYIFPDATEFKTYALKTSELYLSYR
jgi:D-alanine-D-alanine ligase